MRDAYAAVERYAAWAADEAARQADAAQEVAHQAEAAERALAVGWCEAAVEWFAAAAEWAAAIDLDFITDDTTFWASAMLALLLVFVFMHV